MAGGFRGPSRSFGSPAMDALEFERQSANTARDDAFAREQQAYQRSKDFGAAIERSSDDQRAQEAGRARLAMTPGVSQGGSTATRPQSDSPLNVGSTTAFDQYGQHYSYDPYKAAESEGVARGTGAAAEDRTRFDSLTRTPGISERMASRLVYGRGSPLDDGEPTPLSESLSRYVGQPTRENAAEAVRHGAALNQFPDRFLPVVGDPLHGGEQADRVQTGTPAWYDAQMQLDRGRTDNNIRESDARIREAAAFRPAPREQFRQVKGPKGEIGRQNMDTNEVEWSGAVGAPTGKQPSALDRMVEERLKARGGAGAPVTPSTSGAPAPIGWAGVPAPTGAPAPIGWAGVPATTAPVPNTGGGTPLDPGFEQELETAYQSLGARGVRSPTPPQLKAELARARQNARGAAARGTP